MMLELGSAPAWVAVIVSIIALIVSINSNRKKDSVEKFASIETKIADKANKEVVSTLAEKIDKVEDRVTVIESDVKHLPDKDVTHRLEIALKEMQSEMGKLSERMKPIANMADRMQEAILEKVMS